MTTKDKLVADYVAAVADVENDFHVLRNSGFVNIAVRARLDKRLDAVKDKGARLMKAYGMKPVDLVALVEDKRKAG